MRHLAAAIVVVWAGVASAQPAPPTTGAAVLAKIEQFYAGTTHWKATFRQTVNNATFATKRSLDGVVWFEAPDHFRFDYFEVARPRLTITRSVAFDGTTTWIVNHQTRTLIQQQGGSMRPALVFLTGASALASQYLVKIVGTAVQGPRGEMVLQLTPLSQSSAYTELQLVVDMSDWHVLEVSAVDIGGNRDDFRFFEPDVHATIAAGWFQPKP